MLYSEKLRQLRTQNNYSQEQLAELLNVSRQAIAKWESEALVESPRYPIVQTGEPQ